ncbi:MAG TPA: TIGR04282 family arsenosugar biosynthesis glycosyltransferase [bacterium]
MTFAPFDAVVVFAKMPEPGKVKSRLGRTIGDEKAAKLYGLFLKYLSWQLKSLPPGLKLFIAVAPARGSKRILRYFPYSQGVIVLGQKGGNLGTRILNATRDVQKRGAQKVLIIGSDCLELSARHLDRARRLLNRKDLVLGPTGDGGYYLVGSKRLFVSCFKGIAWSTSRVLYQTLQKARQGGATTGLLPRLFDVDEAQDLIRLARKLKTRNPWAGPILKEIKRSFSAKITP